MKVRLLHVLDLSTEPNTQGSYVRFFTVTIVLNSTLETPKKQSGFFLAQLHNISPPLTFSSVVKSTRNGKLRWFFGRFQTLIWRPGETVQNLESPGLSGRVDSPGLGGERRSPYAPLHTSTQDKPERVPFVVTYNPALRSILSDYSQKFSILISFSRCSKVSKAAPIVAYRRAVNTR